MDPAVDTKMAPAASPPAPTKVNTNCTKNKAVFVFIPGAWHPVHYFQPIRARLREKGHESVAIGHKSLEPINPGSSPHDDAAKAEAVVQGLVEKGCRVVVVMHSYGGFVGTQAIGRLLDAMKSAAANDAASYGAGKILHLVYVAALVPLKGESFVDMGATMRLFARSDPNAAALTSSIEVVDGKVVCKDDVKDVFYRDLNQSDRDYYFRLLEGMPASVSLDTNPITHAGWQSIPSTYVHTTADRAVTPALQAHMRGKADKELAAQAAEAAEAGRNSAASVLGCFHTAFIDSDHCSVFILPSHVETLADVLLQKAC